MTINKQEVNDMKAPRKYRKKPDIFVATYLEGQSNECSCPPNGSGW